MDSSGSSATFARRAKTLSNIRRYGRKTLICRVRPGYCPLDIDHKRLKFSANHWCLSKGSCVLHSLTNLSLSWRRSTCLPVWQDRQSSIKDTCSPRVCNVQEYLIMTKLLPLSQPRSGQWAKTWVVSSAASTGRVNLHRPINHNGQPQ